LLMASNTDAIHWPLVRRRLAAVGIKAPAVLSFQLGLAKPAVDFFEAIMSRYVNFPGPVGYIDDQVINVKAALEVGLRATIHTTAACSIQWIRDSFHTESIVRSMLALIIHGGLLGRLQRQPGRVIDLDCRPGA
jgi:FMN phosphatase YigB (HAD superfamily)